MMRRATTILLLVMAAGVLRAAGQNASVNTSQSTPIDSAPPGPTGFIHRMNKTATARINAEPVNTAICLARKSPTMGASHSVRAMPWTISTAMMISQTATPRRIRKPPASTSTSRPVSRGS